VWSWEIPYLPTTVRGIWLYLYLVIDASSRKVVAWDVDEREDPAIAADLVSRACLRERISKGRKQLSSDIRFWSSGDTKTGPPDGLLMGP